MPNESGPAATPPARRESPRSIRWPEPSTGPRAQTPEVLTSIGEPSLIAQEPLPHAIQELERRRAPNNTPQQAPDELSDRLRSPTEGTDRLAVVPEPERPYSGGGGHRRLMDITDDDDGDFDLDRFTGGGSGPAAPSRASTGPDTPPATNGAASSNQDVDDLLLPDAAIPPRQPPSGRPAPASGSPEPDRNADPAVPANETERSARVMTISDLRQERHRIVEEARRRTLEAAQAEAATDEYRQRAMVQARTSMEERNTRARNRIIHRARDEARAAAARDNRPFRDSDFNEEEALRREGFEPEVFNEAEFVVPEPTYIRTESIRYEGNEEHQIHEINEKIEAVVHKEERSLEFLASPEWGEEIAEKITHWEAMVDDGRYEEVNWPELNATYEDQIIHIEAKRMVGSRRNPKPPPKPSLPSSETAPKVNPEKLDGLNEARLYELIALAQQGKLTDADYKDIDRYFEEAKRVGILASLDTALSTIYNEEIVSGIRRGLSLSQIKRGAYGQGIDQQINEALEAVVDIYRMRRLRDEGVALLGIDSDGRGRELGVWDLYAELARKRFYNAVDLKDDEGFDDYEYKTSHEFKLARTTGVQETFWGLAPSGYYIEVYARTPQEYEIAGETYISYLMGRTSDPQEIFQEAQEFIRTIDRSRGRRSPEFLRLLREPIGVDKDGREVFRKPDATEQEFISKLIKKIQARLGVFGADHSNELYHGDQYKQFMDFLAKDGDGPARWLLLAENPLVAAALWKMDKDPRFRRILFALHGSRGQLASDTAAQRTRDGSGLHWQIEEILVKEILGTSFLNPQNVDELTANVTDKQFAEMFEGLYRYGKVPEGRSQGDGNIRVYEQYGTDPKKVPKELRSRWRLGKIQLMLLPTAHGGGGLKLDDLNSADRDFYNQSLARAKEAVHIAMEVYGALGEKSKRGGGVVKVRKIGPDGKEYLDYVVTEEGEKLLQFAEAMTETEYADDADCWANIEAMKRDAIGARLAQYDSQHKRPILANFKARYRAAKVAQAREKALDEFAGVEYEVMVDKDGKYLTRPPQGCILQNGYVLRPLANGEKTERGRNGKNIVRFGGKGFESKLYRYDANGRRVGAMLLNRPLEVLDPATGQEFVDPDDIDKGTGQPKDRRVKEGDVIGYGQAGEEIRLRIGADGRLQGVEYDPYGRAILFNKPRDGRRINDNLRADSLYEIKQGVIVEKACVTFNIATKHLFADWTSHTYWSYQEEDRHLLLSPQSFMQARLVLAGIKSPEEVDEWARQLLKLDPTLCRVRRFTGSDYEDRERKLTMAAVEHKYQSHWRISRELHRAFFPTYGTPIEFNGLYYGLQDFGGFRKMLESFRARIGEDTERFARRGKRLIPDLHIPYAAASEMWGVGTGGALGVLRLMALPVYRGVGTFALDKFAAQSGVANKMYSALVESRNSQGGYEEALLLKPTNNSDKLTAAFRAILPAIERTGRRTLRLARELTFRDVVRPQSWLGIGNQSKSDLELSNNFGYGIIDSLGRYKTYMQLFPLMETAIRNSSGAFWFAADENSARDILTNDAAINNTEFNQIITSLPSPDRWERQELEDFIHQYRRAEELTEQQWNEYFNVPGIDDQGSPDTGSGRHSAQIFHDTFGKFLVAQGPRGGGRLYPGERYVYARIFDKMVGTSAIGISEQDSMTFWAFVFSKLVPT